LVIAGGLFLELICFIGDSLEVGCCRVRCSAKINKQHEMRKLSNGTDENLWQALRAALQKAVDNF
jgi:hypothetical protein